MRIEEAFEMRFAHTHTHTHTYCFRNEIRTREGERTREVEEKSVMFFVRKYE